MGEKVSVVVTTRNRSALLQQTLRCVYDQTWTDKEVIVVDEASTDDTLQVLAQKFPGAKVIRHEVARGASAARNSGVAAATGDWLFFLDDDDLIHPRHLQELHEASLAAPPNSIVSGPMRDFTVIGSEIRFAPTFCAPANRSDVDTMNEFLEPTSQRTVAHSSILWPRSVFAAVKWDENLGFNEDFDIFGRTILSGRRIVGRRAGKYYVRMHSGPRVTEAKSAIRLVSPLRYWLKWSDILLPRPDRERYAQSMRNGMMTLLNEWSGVPVAQEYIPRLHQAFKAWGGTRYYMAYPPRNKLKRALLQGLLDFGGPSLLRRFLSLAARFRGQSRDSKDYVAGFERPATANDIADADVIRPYR
ncbi:MAG: glycosyltransferase family 2 protein [Enhydrobacter sp.]